MSSPDRSEEQVAIALYNFAAERMEQGVSSRDIENQIIGQGYESEVARVVVRNLLDVRREALRKSMRNGALWCVGGILVTFVTLMMASSGGSYVVAWGAIVYGAIQFLNARQQLDGLTEGENAN